MNQSAGRPTRVEIISEDRELSPLADPWRELAELRGNAFVTPEWFTAWRNVYGEQAQLTVVAVWSADELLGVVPLQLSRSGGVRLLRFGGSNVGDTFHAAARAENEAIVWQAAVTELTGHKDWGALLLERVPLDVPGLDSVPRRGRRGLNVIALGRQRMPAVDLSGLDWEAYLAGRSRNLRSRIGREMRRLDRDHGLSFRQVEDPAGLDNDLRTFFRLHEARWAERGGSGSLVERSREFHTQFARGALKRGWLRLWLLELESHPAAAWYGWRLGDRYSYYLMGFEPRWARHGLGNILLARTVQAAIEEGASEYDLLLGEESYKYRFATTDTEVQTLALARRFGLANAVLRGEQAARRAFARLPEGAKASARRGLKAVRDRLPSSVER